MPFDTSSVAAASTVTVGAAAAELAVMRVASIPAKSVAVAANNSGIAMRLSHLAPHLEEAAPVLFVVVLAAGD